MLSGPGKIVQSVEYLPCKCEDLNSVPSTHVKGRHGVSNPSAGEKRQRDPWDLLTSPSHGFYL